MSSGARGRWRASRPSSCTDAVSAPCRSSRTTRTGCCAAAAANRDAQLLEQPEPGGVGVVLGGGRPDLGQRRLAELLEGLHPRPERGRAGVVGAAAPGHGEALGAGRLGGGLGQAGLADARPRPPARRRRGARRPPARPASAGGRSRPAVHDRGRGRCRRPPSRGRRHGAAGASSAATGRGVGSAGRGTRRSRDGSWRSTARSRSRSSGPGSMPSSSRSSSAQRAAGVQRLGLPVGGVERGDQPGPQPLAQGVLGDQVLQVADRGVGPPGGEQGVAAPLACAHPQLGQPEPLGGASGLSPSSGSGSPRHRPSASSSSVDAAVEIARRRPPGRPASTSATKRRQSSSAGSTRTR